MSVTVNEPEDPTTAVDAVSDTATAVAHAVSGAVAQVADTALETLQRENESLRSRVLVLESDLAEREKVEITVVTNIEEQVIEDAETDAEPPADEEAVTVVEPTTPPTETVEESEPKPPSRRRSRPFGRR